MSIWRSRTLWGVLLVIMGILFLLESLAIVELGVLWAVLFAVAGLAFGYTFLEDRERWWAVIPAMALLGIAALIAVDVLLPQVGEVLGGSIFLIFLALAFLIIYGVTRRVEWWAVIPGGILLVLGVLLALEPVLGDDLFAGLFLIGIGLTFAVIYLLPTPEGRMGWALIPAGILALVGLLVLTVTTELAIYIWPIALIVVGAYLLLRNLF